MNPRVVALFRELHFLARFPADLARHDVVTQFAPNLAVPDRRVRAIASPSGIEVGEGAITELVKSAAVRVDEAHGGDPVVHVRVVLQPAKEHEMIASNGPRGLKIPVPARDRLRLRLAEHGDMDFTVLIIRCAWATSVFLDFFREGIS